MPWRSPVTIGPVRRLRAASMIAVFVCTLIACSPEGHHNVASDFRLNSMRVIRTTRSGSALGVVDRSLNTTWYYSESKNWEELRRYLNARFGNLKTYAGKRLCRSTIPKESVYSHAFIRTWASPKNPLHQTTIAAFYDESSGSVEVISANFIASDDNRILNRVYPICA